MEMTLRDAGAIRAAWLVASVSEIQYVAAQLGVYPTEIANQWMLSLNTTIGKLEAGEE